MPTSTDDDGLSGLSTAERVAHVLRQEIASGQLPLDALLPAEHVLIERFGVSRPTCREALRILQSEGLVTIVRGNRGGARINAPAAERIAAYASVFLQMRQATIMDVFEARRLVEPHALARVALRGDSGVLSQLAQNATAQRFLVEDRPAFYKKAREFREIFLDHCGSEPLRLIGLMLDHIADRHLTLLSIELPHQAGQEDRFRASIDLKAAMIDSMIAKDIDDVKAKWDTYLVEYMEGLRTNTPEELRHGPPFALE